MGKQRRFADGTPYWVPPEAFDPVDPERAHRCNKLGNKIREIEKELRASKDNWQPGGSPAPRPSGGPRRKPLELGETVISRSPSEMLTTSQSRPNDPLYIDMTRTLGDIKKFHRTASEGKLGEPYTLENSRPCQDLFTSESRKNYFWKKPAHRDVANSKRFCNIKDDKWVFREQIIQQRVTLRGNAFM
jgi:hypothetical protein